MINNGSSPQRLLIEGERLVGMDFASRHRSIDQFTSVGSQFIECSFDGIDFSAASFGAGQDASEYRNCSFSKSKLRMQSGGFAKFIGCSFEGTRIENWFCSTVDLENCVFSGVLRKVVFNGRPSPQDALNFGRTKNAITGNDFSRAKFRDVSFRNGVDLSSQKFTQNGDLIILNDAPTQVRRARVAFNSWNDPRDKEAARGFLEVMEGNVADGQSQLLVRVDDYPRSCRDVISRLLLEVRA